MPRSRQVIVEGAGHSADEPTSSGRSSRRSLEGRTSRAGRRCSARQPRAAVSSSARARPFFFLAGVYLAVDLDLPRQIGQQVGHLPPRRGSDGSLSGSEI